MIPGEWRSRPDEDVDVGRYIPPSSDRVADFMKYFEDRFRWAEPCKSWRWLPRIIVSTTFTHFRTEMAG